MVVGCLAWYFLAGLTLIVITSDGNTSALVVILVAAAAVHIFWIMRKGLPPSSTTNQRGRSPHSDLGSTSTRSSRVPIPPDVRRQVLARDEYTCRYCGRYGPAVRLEIDHLKPFSKGGTNDTKNLLTACFECNRAKGARLLDEAGMRRFQEARTARARELRRIREQSKRRGCALLPCLVIAVTGIVLAFK